MGKPEEETPKSPRKAEKKMRPENEDKRAGEGSTQVPAVTVTPASPEGPRNHEQEKVVEMEPTKGMAEKELAEEMAQEEPAKEVAQKELAKEVAQKELAKEVAQKEPAKEVAQKEPAKEMAQKEPAKEVAQKELAKEVAQKELAKEVAQKEPAKEVAQKEPAKEMAQKEPAKEVAQKEPAKEVAQKESTKELKEKKEKPKKVKVTSPLPPPLPVPKSFGPDMCLKETIRWDTWNRLEASNFVRFPRPCWWRIPRFKGENEAVERLAKLDIFKNAKLVKVNLDKAHERLRLEIIQSGKELVAGTPGLQEAVFLVMHPPMESSPDNNKAAASRKFIHFIGDALDFQAKQAELVILGSVAVDKKGHRIGRKEGFSDLEFALLSKLGTIPPNAVIATLVHDAQVYEEFPESIFEPYDVPVDFIITPTRVIEVEKKLERPTLRWDYLSKRRIDRIPIIRQLLDREQASGAKIQLKEVESDTESICRRYANLRKRFTPRIRQVRGGFQPRQVRGPRVHGSSAPPSSWRQGARSYHRRRPRRETTTSTESPKSERLARNNHPRSITVRRQKPRYTVDFSVKVNGLTKAVRVRDLKAALVERGVRPADIDWRATKGVALLHFAKRREVQKEQTSQDKNVDDVVKSLQGLSVTPKDGPKMDLSVEPAPPLVLKSKVLEGLKPAHAQGPGPSPGEAST